MNLLDLTKSFELNLTKADILVIPAMQTRLAIDKSGSMDDEFRNGWVQKAIDLFLAVALKFDDNGELDVGFYNNSFEDSRPATAADVGGYIKAVGQRAGGGTSFAPALKAFKYQPPAAASKGFLGFGKKAAAPDYPVYLGYITDGVNDDKAAFEAELASLEQYNRTFLQIIAIGGGVDKSYLEKIKGRKNVSVIYLPNPSAVGVDEFYENLCHPQLKEFIANLK